MFLKNSPLGNVEILKKAANKQAWGLYANVKPSQKTKWVALKEQTYVVLWLPCIHIHKNMCKIYTFKVKYNDTRYHPNTWELRDGDFEATVRYIAIPCLS